jgi:hypothetical protein
MLHDRAGHVLHSCLIEKNIISDTVIFDFAVVPSGDSLTIGLHECRGPSGDVNVLQCYTLPELKLKWEKEFPDDEEFQLISPHGVLTSGRDENSVYNPVSGDKQCVIPKATIKGYFDDACKYGFVRFTPGRCLVYIEGVSGMDDAEETANDITIYRFSLEDSAAVMTSHTIESPRRKRAYSENAVRYDPQTDTLHMGSRTGVIDVFDAGSGKLVRSIRVQAPDSFDPVSFPNKGFDLPIPLPEAVSERPLVLCVQRGEYGVLCSVDENNKAVPLIRSENTELYGFHPTLPLAFFESECLFNIGILDYKAATVDGAILAFQLEGPGIGRISASERTIWTSAGIYDPARANVCEVSEWSLAGGENLGRCQITSATQEGGFSAKEGQCFLTSEYEGIEVSRNAGVTKHSWNGQSLDDACAGDPSFYFVRHMRGGGGFDLMSAQRGETSVTRSFPRYLFRGGGCSLASDRDRFAMAGCARLSTRGTMIDDQHYILVFDRDSGVQREIRQDDGSNFNNMVWVGERLVVVEASRVTWYDDPFTAEAEVKKDDGQVSGSVGSVHRLGDDLVVVSWHQEHLVISVCGWDEEGLYVKQERRIFMRGNSLNDDQDRHAIADGCFFYATKRYVVATRISD